MTDVNVKSVWSAPGYIPALIAVAAAFGSWAMLLPVIPVAVLDSTGSAALAGASTGVFMVATVVTQLFMPRVLRRFTYRSVIVMSAVLLGVPALLLSVSMSPAMVFFVSIIRGMGFGAMTVSEAAIIPELVPRKFLGKATGIFGASGGLAQMITLPVGLAVAERFGYFPVWILALLVAAVGAAACFRIPALKGEPAEPKIRGAAPGWIVLVLPALALVLMSGAYSLISNFLPAAIRESGVAETAALGGIVLAVVNLAVMFARLASGAIADRRGAPGALMIPAHLFGAAGMAGFAWCLHADSAPAWIIATAFMYGIGFGLVQNESLLSLYYRCPPSQMSLASTVWNISFDGGQAAGSFLFGFLIVGIGAPWSFAVGAVILLLGLIGALTDFARSPN